MDTVTCPTCSTEIAHSFHGWVCPNPDCDFFAADDSAEEYALLMVSR